MFWTKTSDMEELKLSVSLAKAGPASSQRPVTNVQIRLL